LRLVTEGQVTEYRICGIYPDITNGGKTAKAYRVSDRAPVVWSVLYVSLKKTADKEEWMKRYGEMGADVTDIEGYVRDTYGQTLGQLRLASATAIILAALVVGMVVMLFIRLIVEENRYAISLHKALGFTGREMKRIYFIKGCLPVAAGVMGGLLVGNLLGEGLCGIILESFGAEGFRFITAWEQVLAIIPAVILGTAVPALSAGTGEIGRIRAYECCNRRD
jgi:putative ABC transport system permease protein